MKKLIVVLTSLITLAACSSGNQVPEDCDIMHEGVCYQEAAPACEAAGCPDDCIILETYPGQVQCADESSNAPSANPDEPVAKPPTASTGTVLFVLSGHTELGDSGEKTGYYLSEVAHPWHVITEAGFGVDFVSPAGGAVEMDPKSRDLDDPINKLFMESDAAKNLEATMAPADIDPANYRAIYYAGGHGAMWDFPDAPKLAEAAATIWENGGIVAAVCHGPAGLINIKLSDGSYLVDGKKVAAFTNAEEEAVELTDTVPFLLATKLEERGAIHVPADNFAEQVVVDDRLVTGQNPASATGAGKAIVDLLK